MGILGRVLIVLNLLAAGGFVYVGMMDYKIRTDWAIGIFKYEIAVAGLPLEESKTSASDGFVALDFQYPDRQPVPEIPTSIFNQFFIPAAGGNELGGGAVTSLNAEVKRVQTKINEVLDSLDGDAAKVRKLFAYLINQPKTFEEREKIRSMANANNALEQLRGELSRRFEVLLSPVARDAAVDADGRKVTHRTIAERREEIGHLLYHLSPEPAWQDRVLFLLGQETYVGVVSNQAASLQLMATRLQTIMTDEQSLFEPRYQELVQKALFLALEVRSRSVELASQIQLTADHQTLVEAREAEVAAVKMELAKARQETKDGLVKLAGLEQQAFQIQREIGEALDTIVGLESDIRKREVGSGR
ncbi:hypothetical protein [Tuwongella immobilis]|uniref:Uncharacterized protein n=1 Tax=Tuwongella immobilis TaxID=692036 RepID=A0A6C2YUV4_9BACT|nr:hypothetical protein [Tuwongella immobilis]VIP04943.1 unnamed protein product [Tuwongella immobilis]VTS07244.1 unnamed protein product [Tuwongella immobilis]